MEAEDLYTPKKVSHLGTTLDEKLKEMGYNAALEKGVIIIIFNETTLSLDKVSDEIRRVMQELSYNYSWGVKLCSPAKGEEEND